MEKICILFLVSTNGLLGNSDSNFTKTLSLPLPLPQEIKNISNHSTVLYPKSTTPTTLVTSVQRKFTYQVYPYKNDDLQNLTTDKSGIVIGPSTESRGEVTLTFEPDYIILANQTPEMVESTTNPVPGNVSNDQRPILYSYGVAGKSVKIPCPIQVNPPPGHLEMSGGQVENLSHQGEGDVENNTQQEPSYSKLQYVRLLKSVPQARGLKFINLFTHAIFPAIEVSGDSLSYPGIDGGIHRNTGPLANRTIFGLPRSFDKSRAGIFTDRLQNLIDSDLSYKNLAARGSLGNTPYLEIFNVTLQDAGSYICLPKLRNQLSNQGQRIVLEVMVPPSTPHINYSNEVVYEGERVVLNCSTSGAKPVAHLAWRKSGEMIKGHQLIGSEINANNISYNTWNILELNATRQDLRNVYSCQADNGFTNDAIDTTSFKLNLYVRPLQPVIKEVGPNLVEGTELEVVCKVKGSNPMPTVFWVLKKGKITEPMNGTYHTTIDNTGAYDVINILHLRLNRAYDKSVIYCNVSNDVLERNSEPNLSSNITLLVKYPPVNVYLSQYNVTLINGSEHFEEIICDAIANPTANVKWTLVGFDSVLSRKSILVLSPETVLMYHPGVRNFTIVCEAFNEYGSASNNLSVQIYFKPKCLTNNTVHYILSNASIDIECPIEASPGTTKFFWTKKDLQINFIHSDHGIESKSHMIFPKSINFSQKIVHLSHSQNYVDKFGTYYCGGWNSVGVSERLCAIHILPSDPPLPPKNCSLSHFNLTIHISCDQYNWTITPQRYVLQGKLREDKKYKNISVSEEPVFNLSYPAISPATIYSFRVLSINNIASSLQDFNGTAVDMVIQTAELRETHGLNLFSVTWIIILSVFIVMLLIVSALVTYTFMKHKGKKKRPLNAMLNGGVPNIYGDLLDLKKDREYLHNNERSYETRELNGFHHPSISNYTDIRSNNGPAIMADDLQPKQTNYTLCLSSVNKSPIVYKNLIPVPNINPTTLTKLKNNNLIYADVETINSHAAKIYGQLPLNDFLNSTTQRFLADTSSRDTYETRAGVTTNPNGRVVYSSVVIPIEPCDRYALGNCNNNNNISTPSNVLSSQPDSKALGSHLAKIQEEFFLPPEGGINFGQRNAIDGTKSGFSNKVKIVENPLKHSFYLPKKLEGLREDKAEEALATARKKVSVHHLSPLNTNSTDRKSQSHSSTNTSSNTNTNNSTSSETCANSGEESSEASENMDISAII